MKFVIDTNIFLEMLLEQEREEESREFLTWVAGRDQGIIALFTIHAIEAIVGKTAQGRKVLDVFF